MTREPTLDKATVNHLNTRLLRNRRNGTTDMAPAEMRLPASEFYCPDLFAREREKLFTQTPQPVAFSGEIARPGSFLTLQVLDVPVLLTRDESGQLRAFINACSHRGAQVASGHGQRRRLVCPFHGWAYSLDGGLCGRPQETSFDTPEEDCALLPLAVSERQGIVVVAISEAVSQQAVDDALIELGEEIGHCHFERYRPLERRQFNPEANWKLVTDLSLESYHFSTLHRDSVGQVLAPNAAVDTFGRHSRWAFPLKSIDRLADLQEAAWPDAIEGSCTYTLFPGVMLIVNALGAQMIRAEPGRSPGESRVVYVGMCAPDCDIEQARQAYAFGGEVFAGEDLPVAEECQLGLTAGRRELLLGRNEPLLQFWHRAWRDALD